MPRTQRKLSCWPAWLASCAVLAERARPDRHRRLLVAHHASELAVAIVELGPQRIRERREAHRLADRLRGRGDAFHVSAARRAPSPPRSSPPARSPRRTRGRRRAPIAKPGGTGMSAAEQLAEIRALASELGCVRASQLRKRTGVHGGLYTTPEVSEATMRMIRQQALGGPEVLELVEAPTARARRRPRCSCASRRPASTRSTGRCARRGGFLGDPPFTVGWDVAGVVEEVGFGVTRFARRRPRLRHAPLPEARRPRTPST